MEATYLREILDYNPETGVFVWLQRLSRKIQIGSVAGGLASTGRRRRVIGIAGKHYYMHRLAWLYVTGEWPAVEIDHINGDEGDNRFANLRMVTREVNMQNRRRPDVGNVTGMLGVSICPSTRRYRARLKVGDKSVWLGRHATAELAHTAYVDAKRRFHEGCTL